MSKSREKRIATQFAHARVPLWADLAFYIDGNSKITWDNGTYAEPKPNAFSLPHIATCPGSTERCRTSCYVHGLKQNAPEVYRLYELNEMALHRVLCNSGAGHAAAKILGSWIFLHASGGFRWHVSGDVFSRKHALWITEVCHYAFGVPFWIYTRSLEFVQYLHGLNLTVNISADAHNYARAAPLARKVGARLCYLVSAPDEVIPDLPTGSVIFPDYPLRGRSLPIATEAPWWQSITLEQKRMVCPADFFGQSEEHRCGPCQKCLRPAAGEKVGG
jgi:hypothetical protein